MSISKPLFSLFSVSNCCLLTLLHFIPLWAIWFPPFSFLPTSLVSSTLLSPSVSTHYGSSLGIFFSIILVSAVSTTNISGCIMSLIRHGQGISRWLSGITCLFEGSHTQCPQLCRENTRCHPNIHELNTIIASISSFLECSWKVFDLGGYMCSNGSKMPSQTASILCSGSNGLLEPTN